MTPAEPTIAPAPPLRHTPPDKIAVVGLGKIGRPFSAFAVLSWSALAAGGLGYLGIGR